MSTMGKVIVHLREQSQPIVYEEVINAYQKGAFYCVYRADEKVHKFPIAHVWRVIEDYGVHGREKE